MSKFCGTHRKGQVANEPGSPASFAVSPILSDTTRYAFLAVCWYQHLLRFSKRVPPAGYYCLDYRELTRDPGQALQKLYQHFGWQVDGSFAARLKEATLKQQVYRTRHRYSLEEFGLSREWVKEHLGEVMDHYRFSR